MPRTKRILLTNLELEVMHVVWDAQDGALTVREVVENEAEFAPVPIRVGATKDGFIVPWFPGRLPPTESAAEKGCALVEVEPDRWICGWHTGAETFPSRPPDLEYRRTRLHVERAVSDSAAATA